MRMCQALPCCKAAPDVAEYSEQQTLIWKEQDAVCVRIKRRKNRAQGSGILRRVCACRGSKHLCAVHMLWDGFLAHLPEGCCPWRGVSAAYARERLRAALQSLGIPQANAYGTHDFRRGHAEDMRKLGSPLSDILRAGQWKSAAFMEYLHEGDMEKVSTSRGDACLRWTFLLNSFSAGSCARGCSG